MAYKATPLKQRKKIRFFLGFLGALSSGWQLISPSQSKGRWFKTESPVQPPRLKRVLFGGTFLKSVET